jgi:iron complex outermembrane receptor protein
MRSRSLFNARKERKRFRKRLLHVVPALALAQSDAPLAAQAGSEPTATVVVVGTSRSDVTALESTAPIDVFTAEALQSTGAINVSEALQRLSPSLHFPQGAVSPMGAGNPRSISLRGLSPELTLVLVNGKRQVASANVTTGTPPVYAYGSQTVDVNMIPLSAVERIEVLRDGASAQYGSDAIAGVVNVVLKNRSRGGNVVASIGRFSRDAEEPTTSVEGWHGFSLPGGGRLTAGFDFARSSNPKEGTPNQNLNYFATDSQGRQVLVNTPLPLAPGLTPDPREATWDRYGHLWGYPPSIHSWNLFANSEWDLGDAWQAYGFATFGRNRKKAGTNHVTAANDQNVRALFPDGIDPFTIVESRQLAVAAGVKYKLDTLGAFDLGAYFGRFTKNTVSAPTVNASFGTASPTSLDLGGGDNRLASFTLDWVKDQAVSFLPRPLTLSAGAAYRKERFANVEGEYHSWADGGVPILDGPNAGRFAPLPGGIRPEEATVAYRNVKSVYLQVENQLTEKLSGGIAVRAERYSDFGSTESVRLSGRYELVPSFALRGTVGTGYRAPSLGQINYTTGSGGVQPLTGVTLKNKGFPVNDPVARALGAVDLKPEKAVNYSLGAVWRQAPAHSLTVDLFQTDIRDKVALSSDFNVSDPRVAALLQDYRDIQIARFFTNGFDVRSRGVDIVQSSRFALGRGTVDLTAGFSLVDNETSNLVPNAVTGAPVLVNQQSIWSVERYAPRDKLILSGSYVLNDLQVSLTQKRYGTYSESLSATAPTLQEFSPQYVTDLDIAYQLTAGARVSLGAKNLFGSKPDRQLYPQNSRLLQTNYSNLAPEGFSGTFVYARFGYDFR